MTTNSNKTATKQTVKCWKCDGAGKIYSFGHRDNGRCYACAGSGVQSANVTDKKIVSSLVHNAHISTVALLEGDQDRAEFYAARSAADMHKFGRANAIAALRQIEAGRFYDDYGNGRLIVRPDLGRKVARLIIEAGKKQLEGKKA